MTGPAANLRNKKKIHRRAVLASVSLLAVLAAGGLVFGFVEKIRDSVDRMH